MNALVERWDSDDDQRRIGSRPQSLGEQFADEQPLRVSERVWTLLRVTLYAVAREGAVRGLV
ncbi:hypothetical protein ABZ840_00070 [Streptomyces sp. NPDC047117]|uniref:hypothetical protein n=1 Tax=Streptomyces sp. NPDC047117 TaxID=3155379 RepID=UPI0033FC26A8